jgi:hypothetical protein
MFGMNSVFLHAPAPVDHLSGAHKHFLRSQPRKAQASQGSGVYNYHLFSGLAAAHRYSRCHTEPVSITTTSYFAIA